MRGELCAKCGERPRSKGQRWCGVCRAEYKRLKRAGNTTGNTGGEHGEQSRGTPRDGEQPGHTAVDAPRVARRARGEAHAECRQRVEDLEAEVGRLKRELARAGAQAAPMPQRVDAVGIPGVGVGKVSGPGLQVTPDGGLGRRALTKGTAKLAEGEALRCGTNCQCWGCRAARSGSSA